MVQAVIFCQVCSARISGLERLNQALEEEWDGEISYPISKVKSFGRICSAVQKLSVFADFSKGKKWQPASGIICLINPSAWQAKRKISRSILNEWGRMHTGDPRE